MSELGDKLRQVRVSRGLSQQDASNMTGIKYKTINDYENGKSRPDVEKLALLCEAYDMSADYFINVNISTDIVQKQDEITAFEWDCINKYRSLDSYGKNTINLMLENELQRTKEQKKEHQKNIFVQESQSPYFFNTEQRTYPEGVYPVNSSDDDDTRITMPVYDLGASAGTGVFLDNPYYELISMPEDKLSRKANFALWVSGNSMEPRFHDGDLVLVKIQPEIEVGEIGIFILNGEGYIKKWGADRLISLNDKYDDIVISEDDSFYCRGKVLGIVPN